MFGNAAMFEKTMGVENFIWWFLACGVVLLLFRIFQILKAIHHMMLKRFEQDFFND